jgi:hypothetical protein
MQGKDAIDPDPSRETETKPLTANYETPTLV